MNQTQITLVLESGRDKAYRKQYCNEWLGTWHDPEKLATNAKNTVDYLREQKETDDNGDYTAWCVTLVSSGHGLFIPACFLHEVLYAHIEWDELRETYFDDTEVYEAFNGHGDIMDQVTDEIADMLNASKPAHLVGSYHLGYHEADGALGILYTETGGN